MKVLNIMFSRGWGGLERYAINVAVSMADRGHEVRFIRREGTQTAQALGAMNFPGEEWTPTKYIDIRAIMSIRSVVKRLGVQIVHVHQSADLGLAAPALYRMDNVRLIFSNYMQAPRPKKDLYHRLEYGRVERIVTGSDSMTANAIENLPVAPDRVITIPYGLDMKKFDPGIVPKGALRSRFGIDKSRPLIGVISRLDPLKGQMEMIEAMPEILKEFPDTALVLTGGETAELEGQYKPELERKTDELGLEDYVIFTGHTNDTASILADLDVYIIPSHSESFSLGCLEAMAMKKPVVGTRAGGTPDMLDNGRLGLLAEPKDPASLAKCVKKLLSDEELRARLGADARVKVKNIYDREISMNTLDTLYRG